MQAPHANNDYLSVHARRLIESYRRWTGRDLVDPELSPVGQARALYEAPFVAASHGTEADPVFNYANRAALTLFETAWADFTSMPSRLSAEPVAREERAQLLARVNRHGFIDHYGGIRLSASGPPFRLPRAPGGNVGGG